MASYPSNNAFMLKLSRSNQSNKMMITANFSRLKSKSEDDLDYVEVWKYEWEIINYLDRKVLDQ